MLQIKNLTVIHSKDLTPLMTDLSFALRDGERLALIGEAEINGNIVEVKSESGLVDEGAPVEVVRLSEDTVFVKTIK